MVFGREPALVATTIAVIAQAIILLVWQKEIDTTTWVPVLTMVLTVAAGLFTRQKVIPVATIKDAGLSPHAVKERAADPEVSPHEGA